jgi:hypothetical protein
MRLASDASAQASLAPDSFLEEEKSAELSYTLPSDSSLKVSIPATLRR